jgi:hypothetical protein
VYGAVMDREELDEALMELLNAGLIEVEYDENLTAYFKGSAKGKALAADILKGLR